MADNYAATQGSGTTFRAKDVDTGKLTPYVILMTEANAALLGQAAMAGSLPVVIASNQSAIAVTPAAGELHLGAMGGHTTPITVTPTLTVHATYASGDYVGTSSAAMEFANAARVSTGSGVVMGATLIDYALQSVACELWLFDAAPTPPADSAGWTISDADALKCIGVIPFSVYYASALNSVSPAPNQNIPFKSTGTSLWGCLVTRGAPAYASGDVSVRLFVSQD